MLQEFNELRPDGIVVLGPYTIDPSSITESQMILNKVETSYWADTVRFDRDGQLQRRDAGRDATGTLR